MSTMMFSPRVHGLGLGDFAEFVLKFFANEEPRFGLPHVRCLNVRGRECGIHHMSSERIQFGERFLQTSSLQEAEVRAALVAIESVHAAPGSQKSQWIEKPKPPVISDFDERLFA
jgi:hypothetical protein